MKNIYLLNVSVSGIKSIKDEVRLDFYKKTVNKNFDPERYRVKAIYGENGSGKTAIITAIKIFQDIIIRRQYLNESKTQHILSETINKTTETFRFSCEYLINADTSKRVYAYSIELGRGDDGRYQINHEILKRKNGNYDNNHYKIVYESKAGELAYVSCKDDSNKVVLEKKMTNLLSNDSFVTLYFTKVDTKIMKEEDDLLIDVAFALFFAIGIKVYLAEEDQHELYFLRKRLKESTLDNENMVQEFSDMVDGINQVAGVNEKTINKQYFDKYKERVGQLTRFVQLFKKDLVSIDIDAKENGEQYECELNLNYGNYTINKEFESTGIKKLIRLFDCFVAANQGGIVFIDEMDSNLNDIYLCKLIEYFMYYSEGQLCFTTHNLDPMSVLKENKNAIDFLSSDNQLVPWVSRGNATPENCYKNGMIENSPFNIDATDFVGMFGE